MSNQLTVARAPDQGVAVFSSSQAFDSAMAMAKQLSRSTIVPEAYRGEAGEANILIALELSNRIGASVMAVMQAMTPIHGKPAWSATFLIATVNTCGRFTPLRYVWEGKPGEDSYGCRVKAKDRETGEELVGTCVTIAMAKAEGWYARNGSKWKTMAEQMLQYRAAAFWTRAYAPELSFGMHTDDEVRDYVPATPTQDKGDVVSQAIPVTVVPTPQEKLRDAIKEAGIKGKDIVPWLIGRGYITEGQTVRDMADDKAELVIGMIPVLKEEFGGSK